METMSLKDVCDLLKIDIATGRNRLSSGALMPPSFRVGRRRLFLKDEVEIWLRELPKSRSFEFKIAKPGRKKRGKRKVLSNNKTSRK